MDHARVEEKYVRFEGQRSRVTPLIMVAAIHPVFRVICCNGSHIAYVVASEESYVRAYFDNINVLIEQIDVVREGGDQVEGIAVFPENLKELSLPQDCSGLATDDNPAFHGQSKKE